MSTKVQLLIKKLVSSKTKQNRRLCLKGSPQKRGTCIKIFVMSPKKPNSACRKVAKVLLSNKKKTNCQIPGIKHTLQKFSTVLVRGGRVRDLPGVKYRLVRGKFDLKQVYDRTKARSKYGIPKPK
jgi:small subunit ribosomal protein S12